MQREQDQKLLGLSSPQSSATILLQVASSDNNDPLQCNGEVLVSLNESVVGLVTDNTGGSQMAFGEKRVPYKINNCHTNRNCKFCIKFNSSQSFITSSHISVINCVTSNCIYLITCKNCFIQYIGKTSQTSRNRLILHIHIFNS